MAEATAVAVEAEATVEVEAEATVEHLMTRVATIAVNLVTSRATARTLVPLLQVAEAEATAGHLTTGVATTAVNLVTCRATARTLVPLQVAEVVAGMAEVAEVVAGIATIVSHLHLLNGVQKRKTDQIVRRRIRTLFERLP